MRNAMFWNSSIKLGSIVCTCPPYSLAFASLAGHSIEGYISSASQRQVSACSGPCAMHLGGQQSHLKNTRNLHFRGPPVHVTFSLSAWAASTK